MQLFVDELAARHPTERIVLVADGAGWHQSHAIEWPANVRLMRPPPYSPKLNPVENLWDELREKHFPNRLFGSLDAFEDQLEGALRTMELDPRARALHRRMDMDYLADDPPTPDMRTISWTPPSRSDSPLPSSVSPVLLGALPRSHTTQHQRPPLQRISIPSQSCPSCY